MRWFAVLLGGLLLGCGMTLHGQVALARYMREEVAHTFVLWRAIGQATFYFQGGETRMALAMTEVPEGGCVVVISRDPPPAAVARLRANRALAHLGWDDVKLTLSEAQSIAQTLHPRGLSLTRVGELHEQTQGWLAAVRLRIATVDGRDPAPSDRERRSRRGWWRRLGSRS